MKLSNISVIFIIIIIPILLLLSYYLSLHIDTINMQTSYKEKHLQATKEAIQAFEINTVEWNAENYSVAESKRRDISAVINTFFTSFANGLGIGGSAKENLLAYIPAVACTMYDGYYIYTPSEVNETIKDDDGQDVVVPGENNDNAIIENFKNHVTEYEIQAEDYGKILYKYNSASGSSPNGKYNGIEFTLNSDNAIKTYKHILKPYSTYSARYRTSDGKKDIVVNYTLDNYITIKGMVDGEYVDKAGYLVNTDEISSGGIEYLKEMVWYKDIDGRQTKRILLCIYRK